MIVKNEADILEETLESVQAVVDEMIIVDTGSADNTKEIAQKYTEHVYDFEWIDDFSAARNAAYSYATKDYILFMDADDFLP
ncbi:glycosyltransferase [Ralstonia pickettii]|nr:glycosyltransferase [Ralstonia pickettii]